MRGRIEPAAGCALKQAMPLFFNTDALNCVIVNKISEHNAAILLVPEMRGQFSFHPL